MAVIADLLHTLQPWYFCHATIATQLCSRQLRRLVYFAAKRYSKTKNWRYNLKIAHTPFNGSRLCGQQESTWVHVYVYFACLSIICSSKYQLTNMSAMPTSAISMGEKSNSRNPLWTNYHFQVSATSSSNDSCVYHKARNILKQGQHSTTAMVTRRASIHRRESCAKTIGVWLLLAAHLIHCTWDDDWHAILNIVVPTVYIQYTYVRGKVCLACSGGSGPMQC